MTPRLGAVTPEDAMPTLPGPTAVVLAGAVANGAFEAGALEVLAAQGTPVTRVLGTSSGALNAALFARFLLAGDPRAGAAALVHLWTTQATWWRVLRPSLRGIATLTGLSGQGGVLGLLRAHVQPVPEPRGDVELSIVVTALKGRPGDVGGTPATTHEGVCRFGAEDFRTRERLEAVFRAAVASAAFPGAFLPAHVPGLGPCSDGGLVDNTPLKHVLGEGLSRVVVIVPSPRVSHGQATGTVGALLGRLADVIVQERLYRDLREAAQVDARLAAIEALAPRLDDPSLLAEIKAAAGLADARPLNILEIRPERVPPNSFAGFFSRALREDLVEQGRAAARRALPPAGLASAA
jgi:NTE family protein